MVVITNCEACAIGQVLRASGVVGRALRDTRQGCARSGVLSPQGRQRPQPESALRAQRLGQNTHGAVHARRQVRDTLLRERQERQRRRHGVRLGADQDVRRHHSQAERGRGQEEEEVRRGEQAAGRRARAGRLGGGGVGRVGLIVAGRRRRPVLVRVRLDHERDEAHTLRHQQDGVRTAAVAQKSRQSAAHSQRRAIRQRLEPQVLGSQVQRHCQERGRGRLLSTLKQISKHAHITNHKTTCFFSHRSPLVSLFYFKTLISFIDSFINSKQP